MLLSKICLLVKTRTFWGSIKFLWMYAWLSIIINRKIKADQSLLNKQSKLFLNRSLKETKVPDTDTCSFYTIQISPFSILNIWHQNVDIIIKSIAILTIILSLRVPVTYNISVHSCKKILRTYELFCWKIRLLKSKR